MYLNPVKTSIISTPWASAIRVANSLETIDFTAAAFFGKSPASSWAVKMYSSITAAIWFPVNNL